MGKIASYDNDADVSVEDKVIGTDSITGQTKNFTLQSILSLASLVNSGDLIYVNNNTGGDVEKSNSVVVEISGVSSGKPQIVLARASIISDRHAIYGVVTQDILDGEDGYIQRGGLISGINTTGSAQSEVWLTGDKLYISGSVDGRLTKVSPTKPIPSMLVGIVLSVDSVNGSILLFKDRSIDLGDLDNVSVENPVSNSMVRYDRDNGIWKSTKLITHTDDNIEVNSFPRNGYTQLNAEAISMDGINEYPDNNKAISELGSPGLLYKDSSGYLRITV